MELRYLMSASRQKGIFPLTIAALSLAAGYIGVHDALAKSDGKKYHLTF